MIIVKVNKRYIVEPYPNCAVDGKKGVEAVLATPFVLLQSYCSDFGVHSI
jgi:hypothetical protein